MNTHNQSEVKPLLIDIATVQREFLPMFSRKRIRRLVQLYVRTVKIGNKILVDRAAIEAFLSDPDRDEIK